MAAEFIRHPLLDAIGVEHGFGERGASPSGRHARITQVHGCVVAQLDSSGTPLPRQADALLSCDPEVAAAVVTADCVPILASSADGRVAVAIHAGWRGLAAGVIEAGLAALAAASSGASRAIAVVGPHIGPCCYEVDAPVLEALGDRYPDDLGAATTPTRPGHQQLDLGALAGAALARIGLREIGFAARGACTACDSRFESFRRDGQQAGRMTHYIRPVKGPQAD